LDISTFHKHKAYIVGINLATRVVVGHLWKNQAFTTSDVLQFLQSIIEARAFTLPIQMIHTDRESLFTSQYFTEFVATCGITLSRGSSEGHQNQVVERLHRTINASVQRILVDSLQFKTKTKNLSFARVPADTLKLATHQAFEQYNNAKYTTNFGLSPNAMDEAFFCHADSSTDQKGPPRAVLSKSEQSEEQREVQELRVKVATFYANNWAQFFMDWRQDQAAKSEALFLQNLKLTEKLQATSASFASRSASEASCSRTYKTS
jgi:transposase InsO family protein